MKTHLGFLLAALVGISGASLAAGSHEHGTHDGQATGDEMIGQPGNTAEVDRTLDVETNDDMRFTPERIEVRAGETIRFSVRNTGQLDHEMVIGQMDELRAHAKEMRDNAHMNHDEPNMAQPAPKETGEIVWHFTRPGTVDFACLIPGHFEAGMQGKIVANGDEKQPLAFPIFA